MTEEIELLIDAFQAKRAEIIERVEGFPPEAEDACLACQLMIDMLDELIDQAKDLEEKL